VPVDGGAPLVLSAVASGGPRISALNAAAEAAGLAVGSRLADARARVGNLQIRPADPPADAAALSRLALWCTRYTPTVAPWGEAEGADGLFLDVTGATHLFGSEAALLADLAARLDGFGLPARLALAGTPGAAWALARFGDGPTVTPTGAEAEALRPLPVEALRLPDPVCARLRRLGFRRVDDVMGQPRAPFTTRFGDILMRRLDQALGRAPEAVVPVAPPPAYRAARQLLEPIVTEEAVVAVAGRLMADLVASLTRDEVGARALALRLHRVDGAVASVEIGLAAPTRSPAHVERLMRLKLESLQGGLDAGHGFEALQLHVLAAERMTARQLALSPTPEEETPQALAALIDGLRQRFGTGSVRHLRARESHLPERAVSALPDGGGLPGSRPESWSSGETSLLRPPLLLAPAEAIEAVAADPDGSPLRFRWRGHLHHVAHAQGPERIAPEWWRQNARDPTRDYYVVEDRTGRRFWMYCEDPSGRDPAGARWFVHGLFA
jgi:protein ImuB